MPIGRGAFGAIEYAVWRRHRHLRGERRRPVPMGYHHSVVTGAIHKHFIRRNLTLLKNCG